MKWIFALLAAGLISTSSPAQSAKNSATQIFEQESTRAQSFYAKHAYGEAAAIYEKLSADSQITALPGWPDALYNLACVQALEGKPALAIVTLEQSVDLGTAVAVEHIREDSDLISLHKDARFQALLARMTKDAALWNDDPALATPYKPVLTEDEKVAGLSKFWSEARFNFAFFARLPEMDWDRQYMDYLPQVRAAQTTSDYYRVMMRFAATLRDGHTSVWPPREASSSEVPMGTQLIEGKVLITQIYDPALAERGINVGAEIVSINGKPVREYAESAVAPYVNGFTSQDRTNRTYGRNLSGGLRSVPVHLELRDAGGETKSVSVHRYCEASSKCAWPTNRTDFKMLAGNIAYLSVKSFVDDSGAKALRDHFATIAQARGLIVDVRENGGGNTSNGYAILSMLTDKPFKSSSSKTLDYRAADRAWGARPGWWKIPLDETLPDPAHFFAKPVIVLTSAATYSAAEDFVVAFDAIHRGTLVGETTGGSTGQPLVFKLPGGGGARICTKDDAYPDGRVFEGVGVAPQVNVSPTISDIRQGRDAALERAMEILGKVSPLHSGSTSDRP